MKPFFPASGWLLMITALASAQQATLRYVNEDQTTDRKTIIRSLLVLKESEEAIFWPLYDQYERRIIDLQACTLVSTDQLRKLVNGGDLMSCVSQVLQNQFDEIRLKKEYFTRINDALNGAVALRFLQSEALAELMEKSKLYEKLTGDSIRWDKRFVKDEALKLAGVESILAPSANERDRLRSFFEDFEFEYSRVVGHQYVWFEQYIEDIADLTPGQCQHMGAEFLAMQFNEVTVKKRFFEKIARDIGEELAARFIAVEDYFTMMAKLKAWSDQVLMSR